MKLFSYIIVRDYGFAPNPFYGYCTLATCMPRIRSRASVGDWVVGTGSKKNTYGGHLIYAMKVDEVMNFDSYWNDPRFFNKRPVLNGSLKQLYGDNIYQRVNGSWVQTDSHHSLDTGEQNQRNVDHDTNQNRLLIAQRFVYFGSAAPIIPNKFRSYQPDGKDLCCLGRGYRAGSHEFAAEFESWLDSRGEWGVQGMPLEFSKHKRIGGGR